LEGHQGKRWILHLISLKSRRRKGGGDPGEEKNRGLGRIRVREVKDKRSIKERKGNPRIFIPEQKKGGIKARNCKRGKISKKRINAQVSKEGKRVGKRFFHINYYKSHDGEKEGLKVPGGRKEKEGAFSLFISRREGDKGGENWGGRAWNSFCERKTKKGVACTAKKGREKGGSKDVVFQSKTKKSGGGGKEEGKGSRFPQGEKNPKKKPPSFSGGIQL